MLLQTFGHTKQFFVVQCIQSHLRIFFSFGDVTHIVERLHIQTHTRHLCPLSSEGSLPCHTFYATGLLFRMVIPGTCETHTYCRGLAVELSLHILTIQVCRGWNSNTQISACKANAQINCATVTARQLQVLFA